MCIISGDPVSVANTKIFVAPLAQTDESKEERRQLTVYCNQVSLKQSTGTMILPFPESDAAFHDLTGYKEIFDDLKKIWPVMKGRKTFGGDSDSFGGAPMRVQVGSYLVSVVTLEQLLHLDDQNKLFFLVGPSTLEFVKTHYPQGYRFVLCHLDQKKEYHPFAFMHARLPDGALFIPTMHYHQAEVHPRGANFTRREPKKQHVDWDHLIYCWNSSIEDPSTIASEAIGVQTLPRSFQLDKLPALAPFDRVTGIKITRGYHLNHDLYAVLDSEHMADE